MELSAEFVALLACPVSGDSLEYDHAQNTLLTKKAGLVYQVVGEIPLLLESEATKICNKRTKSKKGI